MASLMNVGVAGRTALRLGAAMATALLVGCASMPEEKAPPVITARYTAAPVQVDGVLDDAAWHQAVVYPLALSAADLAEGKVLTESGEVRVAWDDQFIYVAVRFVDSDIVAEGEEDQLHHYRMGDVAEFFLKPADHTWYWEMYVTPSGRKTTLWFPGRGRLGLPSAETSPGGLRVAALRQGVYCRLADLFRLVLAFPHQHRQLRLILPIGQRQQQQRPPLGRALGSKASVVPGW